MAGYVVQNVQTGKRRTDRKNALEYAEGAALIGWIPIVAIVSGIAILHEPLSLLQGVAIASTVLALWLALVPGKPAPDQPTG